MLRLALQFTLMLKNPSELKRFKTINKECSFVLTESYGLYVQCALYSRAKYPIAYIYPDLNQCVCSLFRVCEATLSISCFSFECSVMFIDHNY